MNTLVKQKALDSTGQESADSALSEKTRSKQPGGGWSPSPPRAFAAWLPWLLHAGQRMKLLLLVLTSPLVRLTVHEQNSKD